MTTNIEKMTKTEQQFNEAILDCSKVFIAKMNDYGTSWRVLRTPSLTDQIFIKAQRIRSIEEKRVKKIDEGVLPEYIGIVNYCVMALIQLELGVANEPDGDKEQIAQLYNKHLYGARDLMLNKNHDYSEAWRDMRLSSLVDIILMKIFRTKQIEDNDGKTKVSEGVDANYQDMINYSIFALIKLKEAGLY